MKKCLCFVFILYTVNFLCSNNKEVVQEALLIPLAMIDRLVGGQPTQTALELLEEHYQQYPDKDTKEAVGECRKIRETKKSSTNKSQDKEKEK